MARIEGILPLAFSFKTDVILMALDELTGIPPTSQGRMEIVHRLGTMATKGGLAQNQLYIDPLVTTISTSTENAKITFDTIRQIKTVYSNVHIICGLSNISFGMPLKALINRTFMAMCMAVGLDSAIIDPNDRGLREVLMAADMLMGNDYYCLNFTKAFRAGRIGPPT
jgi:5-methyltetrahydrofolate--homocysteine methyltransferase